MTQLNYLIRKRADLNDTEFRSACDRYEAFLQASAEALGIKNAAIHQKVASICEQCFGMSRKLQTPAFDAQITLSWDSIDDYIQGAGSAHGIATMDALVEQEKKFIDLGKSQAFFVERSAAATSMGQSTIGSEIFSS